MKQKPTSTDRFDAVKRCFDAYGADIAKWPAEKRERFGAFAASDEMAPFREEAETLDGFLGDATAPRMSGELKNVITAQYEPSAQKTSLSNILQGVKLQQGLWPAGALAGIGVLGLVSGVLTANAQITLTPEAEAYAYAEDIFSLAMIDEEEGVQWDED